jgi:ATP-dependent Clp protease ATP-binding subunit ClpC
VKKMFERFTESARQAVVLAQDEARALRHDYIGTEHILLGMLREEQGLAARVLGPLGITIEAARTRVIAVVGRGDEVTYGQMPFTPRAKKVLELSLREALSLGHEYIGTEHILLGLVRENAGVASRVLYEFDVSARRAAEEVAAALHGMSSEYAKSFGTAPALDSASGPYEFGSGSRRPGLPGGWLLAGAVVGFPLGLALGWLIWA